MASSELAYTEKVSDQHWWIGYRRLRVLTTTKAEVECDKNEGIASSENLRHIYVKMLKYEDKENTHRNQRSKGTKTSTCRYRTILNEPSCYLDGEHFY